MLAIGNKKVSCLLLADGGGVSAIVEAIREGVERDGRVRGAIEERRERERERER